jgi:hypothetical protein
MTGNDKTENRIFNGKSKYRSAKLLFVPIVVGVTIIFWLFEGIEGPMVGFGYGLVGGLFLIHESLAVKKNTNICLRGIQREKIPEKEKKKDEPVYLRYEIPDPERNV